MTYVLNMWNTYILTLASNEVTDEGVTQLVKVCNRCRGQFLEPHPMSCPKPNTRICDHDRHANIKFKPNINKNQLKFLKTFPKAYLFLFILVSLLLDIIFHLIIRAFTPYSKYNIIHQSFNSILLHNTSLNTLRYTTFIWS